MFFKNKKIFKFEDIFSWVGFSLLCLSSRSPISAGFLILVASAYNRPTFHLCIMYIVHCVITCDIVYSSFYVVQCTGPHTSGLFCTCNLYLVYNRIWCDIMCTLLYVVYATTIAPAYCWPCVRLRIEYCAWGFERHGILLIFQLSCILCILHNPGCIVCIQLYCTSTAQPESD